jgi:hypothetical protein
MNCESELEVKQISRVIFFGCMVEERSIAKLSGSHELLGLFSVQAM